MLIPRTAGSDRSQILPQRNWAYWSRLQRQDCERIRPARIICQGSQEHYITDQLLNVVERFEMWTWVKAECQHVKDTITKFRNANSPDSALPSKVNDALGALECMIVHHLRPARSILKLQFLVDSQFSACWSFQTIDGKPWMASNSNLTTNALELLEKDLLHWAILHLWRNKTEHLYTIDNGFAYSILDNYLEKATPAQRSRFTHRFRQIVADATALHEILSAIRLNRPLNVPPSGTDCCNTEDRGSWRWYKLGKVFESARPLATNEQAAAMRTGARLENLIQKFQAVPLPSIGRPDKSWVESFEKRHVAMSGFWDGLMSYYTRYKAAFGKSKEESGSSLKVLLAHKAPAYLEAVQAEKMKLLVKISGPSATANPAEYIPIQWDHKESGPGMTSVAAQKKTRPSDNGLANVDQIVNEVENLSIDTVRPVPKATKVFVKKYTFNILSSMFPSGEMVDWDVFVAAMKEVGFPATHTGTGSIVSFEADETLW